MKNEIKKQVNNNNNFTVDDVTSCWENYKEYLVEILNGEYKVEDAREDLLGLIGSQWDSRNGP